MREEVIEAMARAICSNRNLGDCSKGCTEATGCTAEVKDSELGTFEISDATAALDAALDKLASPSEEMLDAGERVAVQPFIPAGQFVPMTFQAMLATLAAPAI